MKHCSKASVFAIAVLAGVFGGCAAERATYDTPDAAGEALAGALRDRSDRKIRRVLGPDADELLHTADDVQFQNDVEEFLDLYAQRHSTVVNPDGSATLVVGPHDWPMPIPMVQAERGWEFDTAAGREEIINRRIGRNELSAIQVCRAIVDAQNEYRGLNPRGDGSFAKTFASDPNAKNGLYWPAEEGSPPSPLGALVAAAHAEGYRRDASGDRIPYHGYYYRILTEQGPAAPGGTQDYLSDGRLVGGFAIVAWPAAYGDSGVMTFIVSHRGVVYERDLGDDTSTIASEMKSFDPDASWAVCPD